MDLEGIKLSPFKRFCNKTILILRSVTFWEEFTGGITPGPNILRREGVKTHGGWILGKLTYLFFGDYPFWAPLGDTRGYRGKQTFLLGGTPRGGGHRDWVPGKGEPL